MLKKIAKCWLAMLFLLWMLPSTVLAAANNTLDTAYPLVIGQKLVQGETYFVYKNQSNSKELLMMHSTKIGGVSTDPYIQLYRKNGSSYTSFGSNDDGGSGTNFKYNIMLDPGETIYVRARACNSDGVVHYNMHAKRIVLDKINVLDCTKTQTATSADSVKFVTVPTSGYYYMDYATNTGGNLSIYNLDSEIYEYSENFYGDGKCGPIFLVAGRRYMVEFYFDSVEGSAKWNVVKGTEPIEDGVSVSKIPDQAYTGEEIYPEFHVYYNGKDIREVYEGNYYFNDIDNNIDIGTVLAEIYYVFYIDDVRHSGYYKTTFDIKKDMSKASVKVGNLVYSGKAVAPATTVVFEGKTLKAGIDYRVVPDKNVNAGTRTATIQGTGKYMGTIAAKYIINKANQSINVADEFIKHKSSKKFNLKATAQGTLTYQTSAKKIATVNSAGKVTLKKKYGVANITVTAAATPNYNAAAKTVKIVVTSKATKIASVKSTSKKKATVKIKKATGAQGYEISYSTDKTFASGVKTTTTKKATATLKKLKSKKTYYVRVRSYRKVGGKKLYSTYSAAKKVKVK